MSKSTLLLTVVLRSGYSLLMTVCVYTQVSVAITMTHQRSGWSVTNNGEMVVSSPFDGYRLSKWRWSHENSVNKWKCRHEIDVRSRQFVVDIDANDRVTDAVRRLSAKFAFQTPTDITTWLQSVNAIIDFQHDLHAWKSSGRTNFQWGRYAFGHEHDVDIEPYTAVVTTAKLSTPFSGFEQLGIRFNNRRTDNSWRANNEIFMGYYIGNVTLDGTLNYNGYNFDSMIRITTPIRHMERIVANVRNARQHDDTWASHADVQYASGKTVSVDSKIGLGSQRMIELEATTPCPFLRQMTYKAGFSGTWRSFQASTELQHNMLGPEKITAMMTVDANNLYRINGQLMIRTPFEEFSSLRITARRIQDSNEHVTTTVSWQLNHFQGSLLQDVRASSWTDFDSRYEIEYFSNRKIELTSSFHLDPKIVAMATLKSPCEHARLISLSFSQEGSLDNFKVNSELSFNDLKLMKTLELHQKNLIINGNIETPFTHFRSLMYTINHNGDWRNFHNNLTVVYNGQEIAGSSEFNFDGFIVKFELHTPWRVLRSVNYQHANKPGHLGWRNSLSVESDGRRQYGGSEFNWDGNRLDYHSVWHNPEEYSFRLSHTGSSASQFSNNIIIKLASDQITGAVGFQKTTDNNIDLQLNMATTFRGYERMEAVFRHEPSDSGFTTTATVSTSLREFPRMSAELTYQRSENQLSSQLRAQLPFEAVQRLVVSLNHQGSPADFSSSLSASVNDKTLTSTLTFKNSPRTTEGSLSLQTPFTGYDRFRASFAFSGEPQHFTASCTVRLPFAGYGRFYVELSHSGSWQSFQTSGRVESSIANLRTASFNVEHTAASWTQLRTLVSVTIPSGTFSAKFIHNGDVPNFRSNLEIRTPLSGYNIFTVGVEHEHLDGVKTSVSVRTPVLGYDNFGLSLLKTGDVGNLQLKAELTTPVRHLERTAVSWSHSVARRLVATNLLVETSIPGYSKFASLYEFTSSQRNWKWSASVETPVRGYERWTAGIEHAKDDGNDGFRTVVQMTSPVNNYRNFAAVLSHFQQGSHIRTQVRVNLPFSEIPQIDVDFRHHGVSFRNFSTSLSVDYAGKKIELEMAYLMGVVQPLEIKYEGSFRLVAPCPYVRDFSIVVSHKCKPEINTGALKVVFNSDDKVSTVVLAVVINILMVTADVFFGSRLI